METLEEPGTGSRDRGVPCRTASVRLRCGETMYARAGSGSTVLLLVDGTLAHLPGTAAFRDLGRRHRVIAPELTRGTGFAPPLDPEAAEMWLSDLIDGLGLERPAVIAAPRLAPLLEPYRSRDGGRLGPVRYLPPDADRPDPGTG